MPHTARKKIARRDNLLVQNVEFFRKMRNLHFEKAWEYFKNLEAAILDNPEGYLEKVVELLIQYTETLEKANEYARSAIRGHQRERLKTYREDHSIGVMEEEIVFVRLLEELLSSGFYMRNRFDTNENIRLYAEAIKKRKMAGGDEGGFLEKIIKSLEADRKADLEEILQISRLIRKRFRIANNIFSVLLSRNFSPEA